MVSVGFFVNINCTRIGFRVDASAGGIKDHTVNNLAKRRARDLLAGLRIDHHHDFAAATHKQAMGRFVNRQSDRNLFQE